ncbi:hypothetical protein PtB15_6B455 [Puccinia triticina]|nr:hypothetical protein PtB15_6B455 [Puccinia triticina]
MIFSPSFFRIAFGQSSSEEGHQDQYYVFCGQIAVKGGAGSTPIPEDDQPTVRLPGAYKSGNISPKSLPSPLKLVADLSAKEANSSKTKFEAKSFEKDERDEILSTGSSADPDPPASPPASSDKTDKISATCGDRCFNKKLTEVKDLAPSCSVDQLACLCKSQKFVKAYQSCCNDHCQGVRETRAAVNDIYVKCDSA